MPRIFMIGGTGHAGGAILDQIIAQKTPDVEVKVLVRTLDKGERLVSKYTKEQVQYVVGDYSTAQILTSECRQADIVINTAPDITHDSAIKTVLDSLKQKGRDSAKRAYYIHTSGGLIVANVTDPDAGARDTRVWDDVQDVRELTSMPDAASHAVTDKLVRAVWPEVNVAIVAPGGILGMSPSIEHPFPLTVPVYMRAARAFNSGFEASGDNQLGSIHVVDLASMYMILVGAALRELGCGGEEEEDVGVGGAPFPLWGPEAYYFGVAKNVVYHDLMTGLAASMRENGVIESAEIKKTSITEIARAALRGAEYDPDEPPPPIDSVSMTMWRLSPP